MHLGNKKITSVELYDVTARISEMHAALISAMQLALPALYKDDLTIYDVGTGSGVMIRALLNAVKDKVPKTKLYASDLKRHPYVDSFLRGVDYRFGEGDVLSDADDAAGLFGLEPSEFQPDVITMVNVWSALKSSDAALRAVCRNLRKPSSFIFSATVDNYSKAGNNAVLMAGREFVIAERAKILKQNVPHTITKYREKVAEMRREYGLGGLSKELGRYPNSRFRFTSYPEFEISENVWDEIVTNLDKPVGRCVHNQPATIIREFLQNAIGAEFDNLAQLAGPLVRTMQKRAREIGHVAAFSEEVEIAIIPNRYMVPMQKDVISGWAKSFGLVPVKAR